MRARTDANDVVSFVAGFYLIPSEFIVITFIERFIFVFH